MEPATFLLLEQCLNQLYHLLTQNKKNKNLNFYNHHFVCIYVCLCVSSLNFCGSCLFFTKYGMKVTPFYAFPKPKFSIYEIGNNKVSFARTVR